MGSKTDKTHSLPSCVCCSYPLEWPFLHYQLRDNFPKDPHMRFYQNTYKLVGPFISSDSLTPNMAKSIRQ